MSLPDDPREALLAAARDAKNICAYLASFPDDSSATHALRKAASDIDSAARGIKNRALSELNSQFTTAASVIMTEKGIEKLHRILTQILLIAEQMVVEDPMSKTNPDGSIQGPQDPILPDILPRLEPQ